MKTLTSKEWNKRFHRGLAQLALVAHPNDVSWEDDHFEVARGSWWAVDIAKDGTAYTYECTSPAGQPRYITAADLPE